MCIAFQIFHEARFLIHIYVTSLWNFGINYRSSMNPTRIIFSINVIRMFILKTNWIIVFFFYIVNVNFIRAFCYISQSMDRVYSLFYLLKFLIYFQLLKILNYGLSSCWWNLVSTQTLFFGRKYQRLERVSAVWCQNVKSWCM